MDIITYLDENYAEKDAALGTTETYTIADTDWGDATGVDPFKYETTIAPTYTIGDDTIVELINDDAVAFANYGFSIGAVDPAYVTVTLYSINQPDSSVTLKVNYKEAA